MIWKRIFSRAFVLLAIASAGLWGISLCIQGNAESYKNTYTCTKGYYANIYYGEECRPHSATIMRIVDAYYPYLARDFGIPQNTKAEIAIHYDKEAMYGAIGKDYGEKPPMGAYYKGNIHILSPGCWADEGELSERFLAEGPVIHELAHFMLDKKVSGNYEIWFSEGIALYMEYKYMAYEWQADKDSADNISFDEMPEYFKLSTQNLAYRLAFEQVKGLVDKYGEGALSDIYSQLSEKVAFHKAVEKYY